MPNYHLYADKLSPREYIRRVRLKEMDDPVLNFQISNNFQAVRILRGYLRGDEESNEYAVLMRWNNIYYEEPSDEASIAKIVRLGLIQWQMRPYKDLDDMMQQAEFLLMPFLGIIAILHYSLNFQRSIDGKIQPPFRTKRHSRTCKIHRRYSKPHVRVSYLVQYQHYNRKYA